MFTIYGENGRIFQGAMEDLWRVEALRAIRPVTRGRTQASGPRVGGPGPGAHAVPGGADGVPPPSPRRPDVGAALSAYAQTGDATPPRRPLTRVADVMNPNLVSVGPDMGLLQAWQRLNDKGVSQAPVLRDDGLLVGLLCRADLLDLAHLPQPDVPALVWRAWLMEPVSAAMVSPVPAPGPETELRRVARVLLDSHLPGLPVVDGRDAVVGFISRSDVLQAIVHDPPLDLWS